MANGNARSPQSNLPCPCGSGEKYGECCSPLLSGRSAPATPEELMRSRYTAFVSGDADYLLRTWDPLTRPATIEIDPETVWLGLVIVTAEPPAPEDDRAFVSFTATLLECGQLLTLREKSRFVRRKGSWYYSDGDCDREVRPVSRNSPCPCGSAKKYKRCCSIQARRRT